MADNQSKQPQINYPTRTIMVTGERVAVMTQMTVRVSRAEQRLVNLSMSGSPATRDSVKRASERLQRAMNAFDDEIKAVTDELEAAGRKSNQRRAGQPAPTSKPVLARKKEAAVDAKPAGAAPKESAPKGGKQQNAQTQPKLQGGQKQKQEPAAQASSTTVAAPAQPQPQPQPQIEAAKEQVSEAAAKQAESVPVASAPTPAAPETLQAL
jgi:hypothetical protein